MAAERSPAQRKEQVAQRVRRERVKLRPDAVAEGVVRLNPGYFLLEALRANAGAKLKRTTRGKMNGKRA